MEKLVKKAYFKHWFIAPSYIRILGNQIKNNAFIEASHPINLCQARNP